MFDRIAASFDRTRKPVFRELARLIEHAVARGELAPGSRVPAERELAARLGVSRTTVVRAYRELESSGLLRGYVGRGTFVCAPPERPTAPFSWRGKIAAAAQIVGDRSMWHAIRQSADPAVLSLAAGQPAVDLFPTDAFRAAMDDVLTRTPAIVWQHGWPEGQPVLREAIAGQHDVPRDSVLVLGGAQQGIDLLARCLLDPGDAVVLEQPGYPGAIQSFRAAGARIVPWDTDRCDFDELERLYLRFRPKLLFATPTFHNPSGAVMRAQDRRELVDLSRRYRIPIVEDATYQDLSFGTRVPPPLRRFDADDVVITVQSFSKALGPGLRLGWLSASPPIVEQLSVIKQRLDPHTQSLVQFAVARLIAAGEFDRHLGRLTAEHYTRCQALVAALHSQLPAQACSFAVPRGGLYLWCRLRGELRAAPLLASALRRGVAFMPGPAFHADGRGVSRMRLCFSALPPAQLARAAQLLGSVVRAALQQHRGAVRDAVAAHAI